MATFEVFAALLLLGPTVQASALEPPVTVYVFSEADEDTEAGKALVETTHEVRKKMERRKKTFSVVDTAEEATVVVEVLRLWEEEAAQKSYQPMNTNDPNRVPIHEYLSVGKMQLAEIEVRVGEDAPLRMTASRPGRRPKDVAEGVRTMVELHLVQYR